MSNRNSLFDSVMTDVSGKVRLESEDPRWIQLFTTKNITSIVNGDVAWYVSRLIEHNPSTGNLVQLLDQTCSRLQQVTARKASPPSHIVEQSCTSLYLTTLIMHDIIASVTPAELNYQLNWFGRSTTQSHVKAVPSGVTEIASISVIDKLLVEIVSALDTPPAREWMLDVKFFAAEFLLCLFSTQIYASSSGSSGSAGGGSDPILSVLYSRAEESLRSALGISQTNSTAFSSCLPVQLVRGLLVTACGAGLSTDTAVVSGRTASSGETKRTYAGTALMAELRAHHSAALQSLVGSAASGTGTEPSGVQGMFIEFLRLLPFGVLHRLFTAGSSSASMLPLQSASVGPSEGSTGSDIHSSSLDSSMHGESGLSVHGSALVAAADMAGIATPVEGALRLPADPLAERCMAVLLILLHNRRTPRAGLPNPFREVFGLLHDPILASSGTAADEEGGDAGASLHGGDQERQFAGRAANASVALLSASRVAVRFPAVVDWLCGNLPEESAALLLYTLLASHPSFTDILIQSGSTARLLTSCLHGLYTLTSKPKRENIAATIPQQQPAKALNQLYLLVVCVLMLAQDSAVLRAVSGGSGSGISEVNLSWYRERPTESASAMDACFLCILRCLVHSSLRLRDQYLLSNACAILHNLALQLTGGLQPYTAERLVRVLCQMCVRAEKERSRALQAGPSRAVPMYNPKDGSPAVSADAAAGLCGGEGEKKPSIEWAFVSEVVATLVQVVSMALRKERLLENVQILYAVMHDFHSVEAAFSLDAVRHALQEHEVPVSAAESVLEAAKSYLSAIEAAVGESNISKYSAAQTVELIRKEIANRQRDPGIGVVDVGNRMAGGEGQPAVKHNRNKYMYQEGADAEEFFMPVVWTAAIRSTPELPWRMLQMTLVDPVAAGFVQLKGSPAAQQEYLTKVDHSLSYSTSLANSMDPQA